MTRLRLTLRVLLCLILAAPVLSAKRKKPYEPSVIKNVKRDAETELAAKAKRKGKYVVDEAAVVRDAKYIRCQVCHQVVKEFLTQIAEARKAMKPGKKLSEESISDKLERMCDEQAAPNRGGEWIKRFDVLEEGDRLVLNDTHKVSRRCNSECRSVIKACTGVLEQVDNMDVSEAVFHGTKSEEELREWMCSPKSVCKKPSAVPADRKPGPLHPTTREHLKQQRAAERERRRKEAKAAGQVFDDSDDVDDLDEDEPEEEDTPVHMQDLMKMKDNPEDLAKVQAMFKGDKDKEL